MSLSVKISDGNSKLGKVSNISMTPIKACNNCAACKKSCYALKAYRMYKATKAAWDHNFSLASKNRGEYFASIDGYLRYKSPKLFRWHVAGDILDQDYLDSMITLAVKHPDTKFLCFTKMHHLNFGTVPANLSIILSMFPTMKEPNRQGLSIAWMQDGTEKRIPDTFISCPGNCETCGLCFELQTTHLDVVFNKH